MNRYMEGSVKRGAGGYKWSLKVDLIHPPITTSLKSGQGMT